MVRVGGRVSLGWWSGYGLVLGLGVGCWVLARFGCLEWVVWGFGVSWRIKLASGCWDVYCCLFKIL